MVISKRDSHLSHVSNALAYYIKVKHKFNSDGMYETICE